MITPQSRRRGGAAVGTAGLLLATFGLATAVANPVIESSSAVTSAATGTVTTSAADATIRIVAVDTGVPGAAETTSAFAAVTQAVDYWREVSAGRLNLTVAPEVARVTADDTVLPGGGCPGGSNPTAVVRSLLAGAVGATDRLVVLLPPCTDAPMTPASAVIPGTAATPPAIELRGAVAVADGEFAGTTLTRLLGEAVGVPGVATQSCTQHTGQLNASASCTDKINVNPYSAMEQRPQGRLVPHESAAVLLTAGLLPPSATKVLKPGASVALSPVAGNAGTVAATVPDGVSGGTFVVEYRTPVGLDAKTLGADAPAGVVISRIAPDHRTVTLLDANPGSAASSGPVSPGDPLRIGATNLTVTATDAVATVTLTPAVPAPTTSSAAPASPLPTATAASPAPVVVQASPTSKRTGTLTPTSVPTSTPIPTDTSTDIFGYSDTPYPTDTIYTTDTYDPYAYTVTPTPTETYLAQTGAGSSLAIAGIGAVLLAAGIGLMVLARPRERGEHQF